MSTSGQGAQAQSGQGDISGQLHTGSGHETLQSGQLLGIPEQLHGAGLQIQSGAGGQTQSGQGGAGGSHAHAAVVNNTNAAAKINLFMVYLLWFVNMGEVGLRLKTPDAVFVALAGLRSSLTSIAT